MTFSKTTEYALRILTLMVREEKPQFTSAYIYEKLKIPKKYLQRLLTQLSKKGLIKSTRGKWGGYALARDAAEIYLSEIVEAVQGFSNEPTCFFGFEKCQLKEPCMMHNMWAASQENILRILASTKLSDLQNST